MKMSKKTNVTIMAFVAVAFAITASVNMSTDDVTVQSNVRPTHPPMPLQMWGEELLDSEAKIQLGFDRFSTPINIPNGVELKSTRILTSEDQSYRQLTQFYGPASIDTSDNVNFNDFLDKDGIIILYIEDDKAKPFNWKELGPLLVSESVEKREMSMINNADAFIVKGNNSQEKSEIMFDIGNTRIDVISKRYTVESLMSIAQTIRG